MKRFFSCLKIAAVMLLAATAVLDDGGAANHATFAMPAESVVIKAEFVSLNGFDLITDPTFKAYCEQFDTNSDGILSQQEAEVVTEIYVYDNWPKIESLAGIEIFTGMTVLYCFNNNLSTLDVSNNTALIRLYCDSNNISALNLDNNTALTELDCRSNNLSTLNLDNNTALAYLHCSDNNLSALDLNKNTALTYLDCRNNNLSALDLDNNTSLTVLFCDHNNLSAAAIRDIFGSLPDCQGTDQGFVSSYNNPGSGDITAGDIEVAEDKNWAVIN